MLNNEAKERRFRALLGRVRTVLSGIEAGQWDEFDTATHAAPKIITLTSGDIDNNPIWITWTKTVQELKDIVRTAQADDARSRNLIADVRRALVALESGDRGVLRYVVDMPQPTQKTAGVLQDDPIYQLWEGARNELHMGVTLAVNNETFDVYVQRMRKIFGEMVEAKLGNAE